MRGNSHVRFLGGKGVVIPLTYPIILEDYKKLPQRTKKQKKYYKKAEQRARRLQIRRVDMLLDSLKTGKPVKQLA